MKRPAWSLELMRDTNAPLALVAEHLQAPGSFAAWHPRLRKVCLNLESEHGDELVLGYVHTPCWGVTEQGSFTVSRAGERTLLVYRARFKGWLVLLFMGWWRLSSHRMWERFVETL